MKHGPRRNAAGLAARGVAGVGGVVGEAGAAGTGAIAETAGSGPAEICQWRPRTLREAQGSFRKFLHSRFAFEYDYQIEYVSTLDIFASQWTGMRVVSPRVPSKRFAAPPAQTYPRFVPAQDGA